MVDRLPEGHHSAYQCFCLVELSGDKAWEVRKAAGDGTVLVRGRADENGVVTVRRYKVAEVTEAVGM